MDAFLQFPQGRSVSRAFHRHCRFGPARMCLVSLDALFRFGKAVTTDDHFRIPLSLFSFRVQKERQRVALAFLTLYTFCHFPIFSILLLLAFLLVSFPRRIPSTNGCSPTPFHSLPFSLSLFISHPGARATAHHQYSIDTPSPFRIFYLGFILLIYFHLFRFCVSVCKQSHCFSTSHSSLLYVELATDPFYMS